MPKKTIVLLPETEKILEQMGLQIKYARLRRKLTSIGCGKSRNQQSYFSIHRKRLTFCGNGVLCGCASCIELYG